MTLLSKPLPPLLAIAIEGARDNRQGESGGLKVVHFDGFPFQRLVVLEESPQHAEPMDGQFARFLEAVEFRVVRGNRQDFVVLLATQKWSLSPTPPEEL